MSDKATPIDQWSLDQHNHTGTYRAVQVQGPSKLYPTIFMRLVDTLSPQKFAVQTRLDPEQARAVATMLLYAADQAEKQAIK